MTPLETIEVETAPHPVASIIVLHGLGADGNDFVSLVQQLKLGAVGPVRFIFPHAPAMPVTINNGMRMRAWYDIFGVDLVRREDEAGLRRSHRAIEALLAREVERGMAAHRIVLAGFSQGCAMALMAGVRHGQRLGGIIGLSGYLPLAALTAAERTEASSLTPVFMAHGQQDTVVPIARGQASSAALQALGYDVRWQTYPMAHSVSPAEIADINQWLLKVLEKP